MPYSNVSELPKHVRDLKSAKKKRRWMNIFNSVFRQTSSESRAFAAANASLKKKESLSRKEIRDLIKQYVNGIRKGKYRKAEGE